MGIQVFGGSPYQPGVYNSRVMTIMPISNESDRDNKRVVKSSNFPCLASRFTRSNPMWAIPMKRLPLVWCLGSRGWWKNEQGVRWCSNNILQQYGGFLTWGIPKKWMFFYHKRFVLDDLGGSPIWSHHLGHKESSLNNASFERPSS